MSEREKLHREIALLIAMEGWPAEKADAVIRLVVEARCDIAESWTPEGVYAAEEIRSTFLPTPKENERG